MNQGLLTPQFGVGRADGHDPDPGQPPTAKDLWGSTSSGSGPTVTIKRRRLVEPTAVELAHAPSSTPVKAPKVFKLLSPTTQADVHPERSEPHPHSELTSAPTFRRRRDPSRKPTLVQHIVFEQPKPEPPAPAPTVVHEAAGTEGMSAKQLRSALTRLDEELRRSTRCREAAMALDAHFKRLGI